VQTELHQAQKWKKVVIFSRLFTLRRGATARWYGDSHTGTGNLFTLNHLSSRRQPVKFADRYFLHGVAGNLFYVGICKKNFLVQLCRGAGKLATPASAGFASPWLSALEIAAGGAPASKKEGFKDAVTSYVFSRSVKLVTK